MPISKLTTGSISDSVAIDTDTLVVDGVNNRVGVGTASPTYQLQVSSSDPRIAITDTAHGTWFTSVGYGGGNDYSIIQSGIDTRLRIDSSGRVTMPYQPYFLAEGVNGGNGTLNSGLVPFNVAVHNVGNHFNTSTAKFTAPVAGYYLFTSAILNYPNSSGGGETWFSVNGGGYGGFLARYNGIPSQVSINNAATIKLAANDTVEVRATLNYYIHAGHGHFSGMLLG